MATDLDLELLYERILTLVPGDELQDSYNEVLQEEISSVGLSLNDVTAMLAKLEELRDVVNRLQQDKASTGGRSASLMEVLDSTVHLQEELGLKMTDMLKVISVSKDA